MGIYDQLEQLNTISKSKAQPDANEVSPAAPSPPNSTIVATPVMAPLSDSPKAKPESPKPAPRHRDTMPPRNHDTVTPRHHDTIITLIRKAVRQFGKEAATHRFTLDEKRAIADIIYTYARQGIRTSENEMARIAINFIIHDYRENVTSSVLEKALRELNE